MKNIQSKRIKINRKLQISNSLTSNLNSIKRPNLTINLMSNIITSMKLIILKIMRSQAKMKMKIVAWAGMMIQQHQDLATMMSIKI